MTRSLIAVLFSLLTASAFAVERPLSYPIVGTGQARCFDNRSEIAPPKAGQPFYGQDAQYQAAQPAYKDNGDGTVTDLNTGLMWIQKPPTDKYSWTDAAKVAAGLNARNFAGHADWRLPNTKELYSIINHSKGWPYIDTKFFVCELSPQIEDQVKNTQYWSSDKSVTAGGRTEAFGVNFATGHIKAYAIGMWSYVRCVRGNPDYGRNDFIDNKDQTITDRATGLMWSKEDSKQGLNWEEALVWAAAKNRDSYLGHNDWQLPSVREMQSIVDYGRIPDAANATNVGTAINPLFFCTPITNQEGVTDCPYYWTSTSCYHGPASLEYRFAWYVSFGRAKNAANGGPVGGPRGHLVAEAGAIRYDAKVKGGGGGPGGGGERIYNYVRLVRGGSGAFAAATGTIATTRPAVAEPNSTQARATPTANPAGPGGGFQLIRPFASVKMNLTEDQLKQIAELEKEAKAKLDKILTPEQQKTLEESRPPRPGQGRPGAQGGQAPTGGPAATKRMNDRTRAETPLGDTASANVPAATTKPSASASVPVTPPNVLVIVVDDLGWGDVSYHKGTLSTPNIDRLAKDGVELARFYAYPVCSPTRAALITGQMPRRYGIVTPLGPRQAGIPTGIPTLPGTFQLAGYQTSLIGKWHIGTTSPPNKSGFDHFYGFMGPQVDYFKHTNQAGGIDWQRDGQTVNEEGYSTFLLADEAIRQIEHRDPKRPFFFEVAFNSPHFPLSAPEEYLTKHKDLGGRATYAAIVDALDVSIGRVLAVLDKQGLRDNTLVLFFSDNGGPREGGSNGVLRSGKGSVYEGGIRTPCVMRWPGHVSQGTVSQQPVSTQDLFPTLAAATGVPMPTGAELDGRNMWPALREGRIIPRDPFLIATTDIALIDGDWKLIETQDGQQSLFRISTDISETTDLIKREPEIARRLIAKLAELKKGLPAATQRPGPGGGGGGRPGGLRGTGGTMQ